MYIYVASPYTHPDLSVRIDRYEQAMRYTADLINKGIWAYSPIVHCHIMAKTYQFPIDHSFWMGFDAAMILPCKEVHVLELEGWADSKGIQHEIEFCKLIQKPVKYAYWNKSLSLYRIIL